MIVQGRSFYPEDVEEILREHPGIYRSHCVVVSDAHNEELVVVAESEEHDDESEHLARDIRRQASDRLGMSAVRVVVVPPRSLSRTSSGKWQRLRVRTLLSEISGDIDMPRGQP
ncbi:AMP-binding enzyme [Nocardia brasiliensis]|uniref:AMP-binding enzyme n=1 Tax=Nocardia brasiliensis TaxID=37326 RepID=UPI002454D0CD|nr:hypothetical protein [Nocardia brasiliensis]